MKRPAPDKIIAPSQRFSRSSTVAGVALFALCFACFVVRTSWLRPIVFPADGVVNLQDNDPWYHLRLLDHQVENFPHRLPYDPFLAYPDGGGVPVGPFFDLSLAAILKAFGGGSSSSQSIATAAAYYAPALSILVCVATFFAGAVIFNRWAGLIAAAIIALLPGPYFVRSSLGFYDHHVMEVLLSTLVLLALALALRQSPDQRRSLRSCIGMGAITGLILGAYLLTWIGGNFLLLILLTWVVLQHCRDHLASRDLTPISLILAPTFAVALLLVVPYRDVAMARLQIIGLAAGLILCPVLLGLSMLLSKRGLPRASFPIIVGLLVIAAVIAVKLVNPGLVARVMSEFGRLMPDSRVSTITEARPLLFNREGFTLKPLWEMFTTTFPMAVIAVALLSWRFIRGQSAARSLLLVWSVLVLLAMFGQSRFAYYAAVVVALLVGFLCQALVSKVWHWRRSDARKSSSMRATACGIVTVILLAVALVPGLSRLPLVVKYYDGPSADWREVLTWLRENSPEPYGDGAYLRPCDSSEDFRANFDQSSGYGVMSWWDYGYWINAIARRIPCSNPTQAGAAESARFFLAQDEASACRMLDERGARYVILDWLIPRWTKPGSGKVTGKYPALPLWAGEPVTKYYERVVMIDNQGLKVSRFLYYPEYYRSMCVRLFIFSGVAINAPSKIPVYLIQPAKPGATDSRKTVLGVQEFDTIQEAERFAGAATDGSRRIAGDNPFIPCIPLEGLTRFRLLHQSSSNVATIARRPISQVRLFEYSPD